MTYKELEAEERQLELERRQNTCPYGCGNDMSDCECSQLQEDMEHSALMTWFYRGHF